MNLRGPFKRSSWLEMIPIFHPAPSLGRRWLSDFNARATVFEPSFPTRRFSYSEDGEFRQSERRTGSPPTAGKLRAADWGPHFLHFLRTEYPYGIFVPEPAKKNIPLDGLFFREIFS